MVETRPATLNRKLLGEFLKNPETIKAFENLIFNSEDLAEVLTGIQSAAVIVLSLSDLFENERVASTDGEVQLTDGGPGGSLTFGLSDTGVTAGVYGSAAQTVQFSVNQKGRITLAQAHALVTTNVSEGTNLYYTDARARNAISAGAGLSYNSGTGVMSPGAVLAAYAGGDTPSAFTLGIVDSADAAAWRAAIGAGTSTVAPAALTKTDDTNVTLTLGGSPATALLAATSLTLGWTGTLAVARGGTGVATSTGSGNNVLSTSPTLVTPILGTPTSGTLTNCTGLPIASGVSGLGASVATFLATPSSANLASAVTDETGSGALVFGTSPTLATPTLASPTISGTSGNLHSGTYTPTLTNVTNIAASTAYECQYMRVGNVVTVSGRVDIDATAAGSIQMDMTIPVASNFTNVIYAGGTFYSTTGGVAQGGAIDADATNDRVRFRGVVSDVTNIGYSFSFTYRVM